MLHVFEANIQKGSSISERALPGEQAKICIVILDYKDAILQHKKWANASLIDFFVFRMVV